MKFIKENLPLITAGATAVAAITASLLGVNEKIVNSTIFLVIILIALLATWFRSDTDPNKEQNPLYTLRTNNLLPNKTKKFLGLKTNLVIVGDKDGQSVFESLREELQKIDDDLKINDFVIDSLDKDLQRDRLLDVLSGADAVIVVRTKELENQPWIYQVVDAWALRNSNVPVLVIDKIQASEVPLQLSSIPEKFYFIPDHQTSLPWRLLKRANERSLAWRNQASFNRSMVLAVLILGLAGLVVGYLTNSFQQHKYELLLEDERHRYEELGRRYNELIEHQKRENYTQLQTMYTVIAQHTKEDYQDSIKDRTDEKLNVSYWVSYQGTYYPLSSSEAGHHRPWRSNEQSIIGCALAGPNRSVQWNETMSRPLVVSFTGEPIPDEGTCGYGKQGQRKLKSMVCASYSAVQDPDPDNIVGVCVFTESENSNLSKRPPDFIKKRTREFYEAVYPLLKDKKLIPQ